MKISTFCFSPVSHCYNQVREKKSPDDSNLLSIMKRIAGVVGLIFPGILLLTIGCVSWAIERTISCIRSKKNPPNVPSTIKKVSKVASELWAGEPQHGPIALYHGMKPVSVEGNYYHAELIIKSGALIPQDIRLGDDAPYAHIEQIVYQHFVSQLTEEEYAKKVKESESSHFKLKVFEYIQGANDPKLLERLQKIPEFSDYQESFDKQGRDLEIEVGYMSNSGRNKTNWFTQSLDGYYGQHLSFHWNLSQKEVRELEKENAGGTSFYGSGHAISHQKLPLSMASEIIITAYAWRDDAVKKLVQLLREKNLQHIKIRKVDFPHHKAVTLELVDPVAA